MAQIGWRREGVCVCVWPTAKTESSALISSQWSSNSPVEINVITAFCHPPRYHFAILHFTPNILKGQRPNLIWTYLHSLRLQTAETIKSNYDFKLSSAKVSHTRRPCKTAVASYSGCGWHLSPRLFLWAWFGTFRSKDLMMTNMAFKRGNWPVTIPTNNI